MIKYMAIVRNVCYTHSLQTKPKFETYAAFGKSVFFLVHAFICLFFLCFPKAIFEGKVVQQHKMFHIASKQDQGMCKTDCCRIFYLKLEQSSNCFSLVRPSCCIEAAQQLLINQCTMLALECHNMRAQYRILIIQAAEKAMCVFNLI